jgi:hypothetical protein
LKTISWAGQSSGKIISNPKNSKNAKLVSDIGITFYTICKDGQLAPEKLPNFVAAAFKKLGLKTTADKTLDIQVSLSVEEGRKFIIDMLETRLESECFQEKVNPEIIKFLTEYQINHKQLATKLNDENNQKHYGLESQIQRVLTQNGQLMDERNKLEERLEKLAVKADQLDEFKEKCRQLERDITEKDSIIVKYQTREVDTQKELSSIREYLDGKNRECEGYIAKLKATDSTGPGLSPSSVEIPESPTKFFDLFKKRFTLEEMASDAQVRHKKIQRTLVQFLLPSDVIE